MITIQELARKLDKPVKTIQCTAKKLGITDCSKEATLTEVQRHKIKEIVCMKYPGTSGCIGIVGTSRVDLDHMLTLREIAEVFETDMSTIAPLIKKLQLSAVHESSLGIYLYSDEQVELIRREIEMNDNKEIKTIMQPTTTVGRMTTKEVADALGVGIRAVQRAVEKLASVLTRVEKDNQGGYLFNDEQVTVIKQEIQMNDNKEEKVATMTAR